jgi:hypothetical protein
MWIADALVSVPWGDLSLLVREAPVYPPDRGFGFIVNVAARPQRTKWLKPPQAIISDREAPGTAAPWGFLFARNLWDCHALIDWIDRAPNCDLSTWIGPTRPSCRLYPKKDQKQGSPVDPSRGFRIFNLGQHSTSPVILRVWVEWSRSRRRSRMSAKFEVRGNMVRPAASDANGIPRGNRSSRNDLASPHV